MTARHWKPMEERLRTTISFSLYEFGMLTAWILLFVGVTLILLFGD